MASLALLALRRVLAWAVDQGMAVRGQLSEDEIAGLERAFAGKEPWSFERYTGLRVFAHAVARLNVPDLPAILSFGDLLRALDDLRAGSLMPWPTHETVTETSFGELGYGKTSDAITRVRDANAASWREHGLNNRELLLRGAARASGPRALVVGAGKLYDIPLRKLAERFEQLILVDIDEAAMAESVKQVGLEPELRGRLLLVRADVTGINDVFLDKARAALSPSSEDEVYAAVLQLLHDFYLDEPPRLLPEGLMPGSIHFACSSMVLSQLATPLTFFLQAELSARFPSSVRSQSPEFQVALGQFTHRVQQAHVRSLLAASPCLALTSDVADQYTALDGRGNVVRSAALLPLLGAPVLHALIPFLEARPVAAATWEWHHVVPTRSKPQGRTLQVAGVIAERHQAPAGQ